MTRIVTVTFEKMFMTESIKTFAGALNVVKTRYLPVIATQIYVECHCEFKFQFLKKFFKELFHKLFHENIFNQSVQWTTMFLTLLIRRIFLIVANLQLRQSSELWMITCYKEFFHQKVQKYNTRWKLQLNLINLKWIYAAHRKSRNCGEQMCTQKGLTVCEKYVKRILPWISKT